MNENDDSDRDDDDEPMMSSPTSGIMLEDESAGEDTEFVPVDGDKDGDKEDYDKDTLMDEDPIAAVEAGFETINEIQEGADEELCIIPDTERVISQAEKEAACSITPLRDLLEANVTSDNGDDSLVNSTGELTKETAVVPPETFVIAKSTVEELQTCTECSLVKYLFILVNSLVQFYFYLV